MPDTGGLPLKPGQVVMSDWTRKQLQSLGWKDGDPIPSNMHTHIQAAMQRLRADDPKTPVPDAKEGDRVKIGKLQDIKDLPPEEIARLARVLSDHKAAMQEASANAEERKAIEDSLSPSLSPGARAAALTAAAAARQQPLPQPEVSIASAPKPDFRSKPASPEPATPTPTAAAADEVVDVSPEEFIQKLPAHMRPEAGANVNIEGVAPFVVGGVPSPEQIYEQRRKAAEADKQATPDKDVPHTHAAQEDTAGGSLPITRCPRCFMDMSHAFDVKIDDNDRLTFITYILGSDRFRKTYLMLNGQLAVRFRSLTSQESALVHRQMRLDGISGDILSDGDYFARLNAYRMSLMTECLMDKQGTVIADVPPVFDIPYDEPETGNVPETRLVPMLKWFTDNVCTNESLQRMVAAQHREFQRLMEALEAQSAEPSFW
jgi:hypothetical protein